MKLKIQNDKDLAFLSDEKWKNDQFLLALTQNKPDLKQFNLDLSFQVKLEKFLAQISQWLTQAAFARSNLPPEEISMVANSINTDSFFNGFYDTDILHLFFLPIQTLREDFFSKFKNLRSLDLTETKLEELPSTIFQSLIYLIKLKIGKSAKRVNKDITQQSLLELQPFLFEFLVSLTSLDLISVKSISHKTFTGLTKLDSLSLDTVLGIDMDNPFRNLRNLKTLSINDTSLIVNEKIFQSLSCLRTLTLSFNPLANYEEETLIEPNAFAKLTSLMTLNFEFHNIPIITQEMFSSLNKLKNLSLKNNKIEAIEFYSFCDLLSLETLDLSENKIERITSDMFYGLINIKKLILKKNCLEYIEQGLFDLNMSRLIELNLSSNNLISIEKDIFAELPNLKFLSLGNNQIETIEANSFDRLTSLDTLLLNGNRLNNLSNEIFKGLENSLKYLNLAQNALSVIRSDSFSTLKCLEFIALTENRIESFDTNLFTGLDNLKKIDVDSNQFGYDKTWADLMFNTSKSLETIIIESRYIKKPITSLQKYAE